MKKEINRLIRYIEKEDARFLDEIVTIASKVNKRRKYLIIDTVEMESIVDSDMVEPIDPLDRIEAEV